MSTITRFEEIEAWKKARELTHLIYQISSKGKLARDFELTNQIRRASVSIMSNIAEGFERGGNKEFIHFLSTAKGSSGEIRSQLYVARDASLITEEEFDDFFAKTSEVSRLISGLIRYLKSSEFRGDKFREEPAVFYQTLNPEL